MFWRDLCKVLATAPHSSTLAWKIPWTEEPGGLQSMGSLRVGHDWATSLSLFTFMHWRRKWQLAPVFLPGMGEPGGLPSMGSHRVGHDWSYLAAAEAAAMIRKFEPIWYKKLGLCDRGWLYAVELASLYPVSLTQRNAMGNWLENCAADWKHSDTVSGHCLLQSMA